MKKKKKEENEKREIAQMPDQGIEPWTTALKAPRSTTELARHVALASKNWLDVYIREKLWVVIWDIS